MVQDGDACSQLADSISRGTAHPFEGGTAAACRFWLARVQAVGVPPIQRAAVQWMAARLGEVDGAVAARAGPIGTAVLQSAWSSTGSRADAAAEGAGGAEGEDEYDQECQVLLDHIQQCSRAATAGEADPEVHSLCAQALLRSGQLRQAAEALQRSLVACEGSDEVWRTALRVCAACAAAGEPQFLGHASAEDLVHAALRAAPAGRVSGAVLQAMLLLRCHGRPVGAVQEHVLQRLTTAAVDDEGQAVAAVLKAVWCVPVVVLHQLSELLRFLALSAAVQAWAVMITISTLSTLSRSFRSIF